MGEAAIPLVNLSERLALARSLFELARCSSEVFSQLCGRAAEHSIPPYLERNSINSTSDAKLPLKRNGLVAVLKIARQMDDPFRARKLGVANQGQSSCRCR